MSKVALVMEAAEFVAKNVGSGAKFFEEFAMTQGAHVEAALGSGKVTGELIKSQKIASGEVVGLVQVPEANLLKSTDPIGKVTAITNKGTLFRDNTGAVFRTKEPIPAGEVPYPEELEFAPNLFAPLRSNLKLLGRQPGPLTQAELEGLTASTEQIKASAGNTEAFMTSLAKAPTLDFNPNPLLGFSVKSAFNPVGGLTNCMWSTAGILRTMRNGEEVTAEQVAKLVDPAGQSLGPSFMGRFNGQIDAIQGFKKAGGVETTRMVGSLSEIAPGRPHAVDMMLKGADGEQRHMVYAYKFKDGSPFMYDAQSGFRWHPDAIGRSKLPMSFHELTMQAKPYYS